MTLWLSAELVAVCSALAVAVFEIVPLVVGLTTSVTVALEPSPTFPSAHATNAFFGSSEQGPREVETEPHPAFFGNASG